jgi:hypothetical protein
MWISRVALCALVLPILTGSCALYPRTAVINGVEVPRPTLEFQGQPYAVKHAYAYPQPRGPSSGLHSPGGTIDGTVCGVDVSYEVYHRGNHVQLIGFVTSTDRVDVQLRIEDHAGERRLTGNIGTKVVDLRLRQGGLYGYVGLNGFDFSQSGDQFRGRVRSRRYEQQVVDVTLNGRDALWQMPAADQAAVVPLVLDCLYSDFRFQFAHEPPPLGFGGKQTAAPRGTLIYRVR